jgi:hypothetical protein
MPTVRIDPGQQPASHAPKDRANSATATMLLLDDSARVQAELDHHNVVWLHLQEICSQKDP